MPKVDKVSAAQSALAASLKRERVRHVVQGPGKVSRAASNSASAEYALQRSRQWQVLSARKDPLRRTLSTHLLERELLDEPSKRKLEQQETEEERAAVHALTDSVASAASTTGHAGLARMLQRRQQRHEAAIEAWQSDVEDLNTDLADQLRIHATAMDAELQRAGAEQKRVLDSLADDKLVGQNVACIDQSRSVMQQCSDARQAAIHRFGEFLRQLEVRRRDGAQELLLALTPRLIDIAHILQPEVHQWAQEQISALNKGVLENRAESADVLARLEACEAAHQIEIDATMSTRLARWRELTYQDTLEQAKRVADSHEFADPPARRGLIGHIRVLQESISQDVAQAVASAADLPFVTEHIDAWHTALCQRLAQYKLDVDGVVTQLGQVETARRRTGEQLVSSLHERLLSCGVDAPAADALMTSDVRPLLTVVIERGTRALDVLKTELQRQQASLEAAATGIWQHLQRLEELQNQHRRTVAAMPAAESDAIRQRRSEFMQHSQAMQRKLDAMIAEMKQDVSEEALAQHLSQVQQLYTELEELHRTRHATEHAWAAALADDVVAQLDVHQAQLHAYYGVQQRRRSSDDDAPGDGIGDVATSAVPGASDADATAAADDATQPSGAADGAAAEAPAAGPKRRRRKRGGDSEQRTDSPATSTIAAAGSSTTAVAAGSGSGAGDKDKPRGKRKGRRGKAAAEEVVEVELTPEEAAAAAVAAAAEAAAAEAEEMRFGVPAYWTTDAGVAMETVAPAQFTVGSYGQAPAQPGSTGASPVPARSDSAGGAADASAVGTGPGAGTASATSPDPAAASSSPLPPSPSPVQLDDAVINVSLEACQADALVEELRRRVFHDFATLVEDARTAARGRGVQHQLRATSSLKAALRGLAPQMGQVAMQVVRPRHGQLDGNRQLLQRHTQRMRQRIDKLDIAYAERWDAVQAEAQKRLAELAALPDQLASTTGTGTIERLHRLAKGKAAALASYLEDEQSKLGATARDMHAYVVNGNVAAEAGWRLLRDGGTFSEAEIVLAREQLAVMNTAAQETRDRRLAEMAQSLKDHKMESTRLTTAFVEASAQHQCDLEFLEALQYRQTLAQSRIKAETSNADARIMRLEAVTDELELFAKSNAADGGAEDGDDTCRWFAALQAMDTAQRVSAMVARQLSITASEPAAAAVQLSATPDGLAAAVASAQAVSAQQTPSSTVSRGGMKRADSRLMRKRGASAGAASASGTGSGGGSRAASRHASRPGTGTPAAATPPGNTAGAAAAATVGPPTLRSVVTRIGQQYSEEAGTIVATYYQARPAEVPTTRPDLIAKTAGEFAAKTESVVASFNHSLDAYIERRSRDYRRCVCRLAAVLLHVPRALFQALLRDSGHTSQYTQLHHAFTSAAEALIRLRQANERALAPMLGHPNRRAELEQLCEQETARFHQHSGEIEEYALQANESEHSQAREFFHRASNVTTAAMAILDAMVLPHDLRNPEANNEFLQRRSFHSLLLDQQRSKDANVVAAAAGQAVGTRRYASPTFESWHGSIDVPGNSNNSNRTSEAAGDACAAPGTPSSPAPATAPTAASVAATAAAGGPGKVKKQRRGSLAVSEGSGASGSLSRASSSAAVAGPASSSSPTSSPTAANNAVAAAATTSAAAGASLSSVDSTGETVRQCKDTRVARAMLAARASVLQQYRTRYHQRLGVLAEEQKELRTANAAWRKYWNNLRMNLVQEYETSEQDGVQAA